MDALKITKEALQHQVAKELQLKIKQVVEVVHLVEEGNTVPFIARYRKERTGNLDEVMIRSIIEKWTYLNHVEDRKEEVIRLIEEQGKLTESLKRNIYQATKLQEIEDLYRPYKQKRRTKATEAKEKGLEGLANYFLTFPRGDINQKIKQFIDSKKGVETLEDAISGAKDILAEVIADDVDSRNIVRKEMYERGTVQSSVKDETLDEKKTFEMYYEFGEPVKKIVPHRILALNRGEKEKVLKITVEVDADRALDRLKQKWVKQKQSLATQYVEEAIEDSYKRLMVPSVEREIRKELTEKAEEQAIHIFSLNLKHLLLQAPLKGKMVLGVDPAYRTGCKLSVVDETGKLLEIAVIYPHPPKKKLAEAKKIVHQLLKKYPIEMVAIGNGTASRETEQFISDVLKEVERDIYYCIVSEAGASVYSASDLAREEFPNLQVEERSAVSIARRLQDPLAELVKIDPKSVGIGQYQHDVSQKKLNESLTFVVEMVVNQVGVNVNTASASLLQYVSGLSKTVALNIVKKREEQGKFTNRKELKDIPRLGAKTYEQCIGFLRIIDGDNPLDRTGIHPESYKVTKNLLNDLGFTVKDIGLEQLKEAIASVDMKGLAKKYDIGELTLKDIFDVLVRPERDPRDEVAKPILRKDVLKLEDLKVGMQLEGTVRNVVDFGAFVDIGVKQDGLVHLSKMSDRYIHHPTEVVNVGDIVQVWVQQVDKEKERVSLTMIPFSE